MKYDRTGLTFSFQRFPTAALKRRDLFGWPELCSRFNGACLTPAAPYGNYLKASKEENNPNNVWHRSSDNKICRCWQIEDGPFICFFFSLMRPFFHNMVRKSLAVTKEALLWMLEAPGGVAVWCFCRGATIKASCLYDSPKHKNVSSLLSFSDKELVN